MQVINRMKSFNVYLFILKIYFLVLGIFTLFRCILFLSNLDRISTSDTSIELVLKAFLMGVRFDLVISGYILALPVFILILYEIAGFSFQRIKLFVYYWVAIFCTIAFIIAAADIPYFIQFNDRLSVGALEWMDSPGFVFSMILNEPRFIAILIPFLLLEYLFLKRLRQLFKVRLEHLGLPIALRSLVSLLFLGLLLLSIRGRISKKSPIRIGTAYFCNQAFLNKLGLNPGFTFMKSVLDKRNPRNAEIHLMSDKVAIGELKKYLHTKGINKISPIARKVLTDTSYTHRPNIIFIIMESMSAAKLKALGGKKALTPFLDSLSRESYFFTRFYSAGKHTFNGIFSSLYSFPALYRQHPLKRIMQYHGLPHTLHDLGYETLFFTTHDSQFDNMEGFLRANAFEHIISQADYPASEVKTTLGVPDDYMFKFALPIINDHFSTGKPFLATFMTASDHGPYFIPPYFTPRNSEIKDQVVEYADWSLHQFFNQCKKEPWFGNTLFVWVADHGVPIDVHYDIPLNYFHIPLIIYGSSLPGIPHRCRQIGGQIDIFPTLMGILGIPYINNTPGIDLLKEKRSYAVVNDDDKIGVLDTNYLCILKENGNEIHLFSLQSEDYKDIFSKYPKVGYEMANYGKVLYQSAQYLIKNQMTSLPENKSASH